MVYLLSFAILWATGVLVLHLLAHRFLGAPALGRSVAAAILGTLGLATAWIAAGRNTVALAAGALAWMGLCALLFPPRRLPAAAIGLAAALAQAAAWPLLIGLFGFPP